MTRITSGVRLVGNNVAQELIHPNNLYYRVVADSTVSFCEGYNNNWIPNTITSVPTKGYWYAGMRLNVIGGGTQYVCTASGTPGTWIAP